MIAVQYASCVASDDATDGRPYPFWTTPSEEPYSISMIWASTRVIVHASATGIRSPNLLQIKMKVNYHLVICHQRMFSCMFLMLHPLWWRAILYIHDLSFDQGHCASQREGHPLTKSVTNKNGNIIINLVICHWVLSADCWTWISLFSNDQALWRTSICGVYYSTSFFKKRLRPVPPVFSKAD